MPAYNEADNIEAVIRAWYPCIEAADPGSRLVVADSGSSDSTHEILQNLQLEFPNLEIITDTLPQHGPKVIALYRYAINKGADLIFQTDSDGQTDPFEFYGFWDKKDSFDAVLGNRTVRGDGAQRAFVERVVCALLKLYFGVNIPDANAPFRLMKASLMNKYLDRLSDDYNLPNIMLTCYFAFYGEKISFEEVSFKPRQAGVNSINIPKIVKIGIKALGDFRRFKKDMKK